MSCEEKNVRMLGNQKKKTYDEFLNTCKTGEVWEDQNQNLFEIVTKASNDPTNIEIALTDKYDETKERTRCMFSKQYPSVKHNNDTTSLFHKKDVIMKFYDYHNDVNGAGKTDKSNNHDNKNEYIADEDRRPSYTFFKDTNNDELYSLELTIELFHDDEIQRMRVLEETNNAHNDIENIKQRKLYVNIELYDHIDNFTDNGAMTRSKKRRCRRQSVKEKRMKKLKEVEEFILSDELCKILNDYNIVLNLSKKKEENSDSNHDNKDETCMNNDDDDDARMNNDDDDGNEYYITDDHILNGFNFNFTIDTRLYDLGISYDMSFPVLFVKHIRIDFKCNESPISIEKRLDEMNKNNKETDDIITIETYSLKKKIEVLNDLFQTSEIGLKNYYFKTDEEVEMILERIIMKEIIEDTDQIVGTFHQILHNSNGFSEKILSIENCKEVLIEQTNEIVDLLGYVDRTNIDDSNGTDKQNNRDGRNHNDDANFVNGSDDSDDDDDINAVKFDRKQWEKEKGFLTLERYDQVVEESNLFLIP